MLDVPSTEGLGGMGGEGHGSVASKTVAAACDANKATAPRRAAVAPGRRVAAAYTPLSIGGLGCGSANLLTSKIRCMPRRPQVEWQRPDDASLPLYGGSRKDRLARGS